MTSLLALAYAFVSYMVIGIFIAVTGIHLLRNEDEDKLIVPREALFTPLVVLKCIVYCAIMWPVLWIRRSER